MSEWKEVRLGDFALVKGGKRLPKGKILTTKKNSHPYIRIRDLGQEKVLEINDTYEYVDDETQQAISRYIVSTNDILISIVGTIGLVAIVGKSLDNANLTENCVKLVNIEDVDKEYLYYFLVSKSGQDAIKNEVVGAVQQKLPIKNIQNIKVPLPPLTEQHRIASILSSLDSKIENNHKICANLEAQAQALFKHWFIDFAPFKDGKFVESELGMIPEGWRVGTFGEIAELIKPSIKPRENVAYSHYSIPSFDDNQTPSNDYGESIKSNKFAIHNSVTMLSKLNPDHKRIWYVDKVERNAVCSTEFLPFYAKDKEQSVFVYCYLNCTQNYREIANGAKGTTNSHQRIDANAILPRKIAYDSEAISQFSILVRDFMKQKDIAVHENLRLSSLRDTLLPKLMSGEIKV